MQKKHSKSKGFGIIEVLISSSIIISVLGGLVYAGRMTYQNTLYLQDKSQAIALAQEGLEIVRQIRDTNWVDNSADTHWNDLVMISNGSLAEVVPNSNIKYGISRSRLQSGPDRYGLTEAVSEKVKIDDSSYEYNRSVKVESTGKLMIDVIGKEVDALSSQSLKVTVVVSWLDKSVELSEILTNWRPNY